MYIGLKTFNEFYNTNIPYFEFILIKKNILESYLYYNLILILIMINLYQALTCVFYSGFYYFDSYAKKIILNFNFKLINKLE